MRGRLTAAAALAQLPIKGRAPMTGYSRDQFGPAWADVNRNGCDTRNDILTRDLTDITYRSGTNDCIVESGGFIEPYTGRPVHFVRGAVSSMAVQIDHVVALGDAWQTGAQQWSATRRLGYANDPLVLVAADGPANEQKGDGDAATWLPPSKSFRCTYVARQVAVKAKYGLWVTPAEHDAIVRVLATCPGQLVPASGTAPVRAQGSDQPAGARTTPAGSGAGRTAGNSGTGSVYYANCAAVRAAGKAPIHRGAPGYSRALDRDGDGVGCE